MRENKREKETEKNSKWISQLPRYVTSTALWIFLLLHLLLHAFCFCCSSSFCLPVRFFHLFVLLCIFSLFCLSVVSWSKKRKLILVLSLLMLFLLHPLLLLQPRLFLPLHHLPLSHVGAIVKSKQSNSNRFCVDLILLLHNWIGDDDGE